MDEYSKMTYGAVLELSKELVHKFIDKPIEQTGLLIADNIRNLRLNLQIKSLIKVKKICEENNIIYKPVTLKVLEPYLEGVSLEEDEEIQDMWANLFVNYIDSNKNLTQAIYPYILKQISISEAKLLTLFVEAEEEIRFGKSNHKKIYNEHYNISTLANLVRLGLIRESIDVYMDGVDNNGNHPENDYFKQLQSIESGTIPNVGYVLTDFGFQFFKACKR